MLPPRDSQKVAKLQKIQSDFLLLQRITEIRVQRNAAIESCHLVLASTLLQLHHAHGMTWDEIASRIDGICDKGHAHRISRRQKNLGRITYLLATNSINAYLQEIGKPLIEFPEFPSPLN